MRPPAPARAPARAPAPRGASPGPGLGLLFHGSARRLVALPTHPPLGGPTGDNSQAGKREGRGAEPQDTAPAPCRWLSAPGVGKRGRSAGRPEAAGAVWEESPAPSGGSHLVAPPLPRTRLCAERASRCGGPRPRGCRSHMRSSPPAPLSRRGAPSGARGPGPLWRRGGGGRGGTLRPRASVGVAQAAPGTAHLVRSLCTTPPPPRTPLAPGTGLASLAGVGSGPRAARAASGRGRGR